MTCKDCMHYDVCENYLNYQRKTIQGKAGYLKVHKEQCPYEKDKSRCIELPCEVGDKVYVICYKGNVQPYIRVETVLHMNYLQGKSLALWQIHTEYAAHNAKDVIYSKSEAEQKLKELKENV